MSASGVVQSPPSKPIPITRNGPKVEAEDEEIDLGDGFVSGPVKTEINGAGISVTSSKNGSKKRGTIFKCESCSKVSGFFGSTGSSDNAALVWFYVVETPGVSTSFFLC